MGFLRKSNWIGPNVFGPNNCSESGGKTESDQHKISVSFFSGNGLHPSLYSKGRFWMSDRDMPDQNLLAQTSKDVLLTKDVQLKSQRSGDKAKLMPLFALVFPVLVFE